MRVAWSGRVRAIDIGRDGFVTIAAWVGIVEDGLSEYLKHAIMISREQIIDQFGIVVKVTGLDIDMVAKLSQDDKYDMYVDSHELCDDHLHFAVSAFSGRAKCLRARVRCEALSSTSKEPVSFPGEFALMLDQFAGAGY